MNIALIGYGKMGKAIEEIVHRHNAKHTHHIHIVRKFSKSEELQVSVENLKDIDVAIEFTTPLTAVQLTVALLLVIADEVRPVATLHGDVVVKAACA